MEQPNPLTPEEKQAIGQLIRHPGWEVVWQQIIVPAIRSSTLLLDRGGAELLMMKQRGIKLAFSQLVAELYRLGGLPDPLKAHDNAMAGALHPYRRESDGMMPPLHWISNGVCACGAVPNGPVSAAMRVDDITCPGCKAALQQPARTTLHRPGVPV